MSTTTLTLVDWAKRLDPDGSTADLVELLNETNEILDDAVFVQGNLPTGHRTSVRTGLPSVFWRLINQGVTPSKSTSAQIDEQTGMMEAWSEVDVELLKLNGNTAAFRLSEAKAFIEAMNQEMASTLFYGNASVDPEEFHGLAVRYSDLSATNAQNIVDMQGTGAAGQTSIWLIQWGEDTVHGLFPKGSTAGLERNDYGEVTVEVTAGVAGSRMRAMQERFQQKAGISVRDWRHVVRGANIDVSDLFGMSGADLIACMTNMIELLPTRAGRAVFYMNRTVRRALRNQVRDAVSGGGGLTFDNYAGKRVMFFDEIPVRTCDALLNTEDEVV